VVQGLTLPPLIRALRLSGAPARNPEERLARRNMAKAALDQLNEMQVESAVFPEVYEDIRRYYERRLAFAQPEDGDNPDPNRKEYQDLYHTIANDLRSTERTTAIKMYRERQIPDHVLHTLERELDLLDIRFGDR
jgi:monovalent cation/hydrogen antiporter